MSTLYVYAIHSMESLKPEKKFYEQLGNNGEIMQRKFCMECIYGSWVWLLGEVGPGLVPVCHSFTQDIVLNDLG